MTVLFTLQNDNSIIMDIVSWTIPFLLGLFSSFIIDKLRKNLENKRNKKFIKMYLKDSILIDLPELESTYKTIRDRINDDFDEPIVLPVFEGFNANVLNGIKPVDHFQIFKEKYTILNEIISIIEYLSSNLPIQLNKEYYNEINEHLKEKEKIGNIEHIKECDFCNDKKNKAVSILDLRIQETNELKKKILELIE